MTRRDRLDRILLQRGLAESREKAQRLIMAGAVWVEGRRADKAGALFPRDIPISLVQDPIPYVGRGGLKLEGALKAFGLEVSGMVALDVGASTGGFTHCLIERGAALVYALDVGRGQLDWRLREDPRVISLEGLNVRYLNRDRFRAILAERAPSPRPLPLPELATVDVSFISLRLVLWPVAEILKATGTILALLKPQFEVGKGEVGKGGIVREGEKHRKVLRELWGVSEGAGLRVRGLLPSALRGASGNVEYFLHLRKGRGRSLPEPERVIEKALEAAGFESIS